MNQQTIKSVMAHSRKGHQILLGHCHTGAMKIKAKYGPFGLLVARYPTDVETFEEISEVSPRNEKASTSIVDLNFRLGNNPAAEKEIQRFVMLFDPESEFDKVKDYLIVLKEEVPKEEFIVRQLVAHYQNLGQIELAISELDGLGDMLLESGNKEAAVAVIQDIINMNPPNIEAYQKLLGQLQA